MNSVREPENWVERWHQRENLTKLNAPAIWKSLDATIRDSVVTYRRLFPDLSRTLKVEEFQTENSQGLKLGNGKQLAEISFFPDERAIVVRLGPDGIRRFNVEATDEGLLYLAIEGHRIGVHNLDEAVEMMLKSAFFGER